MLSATPPVERASASFGGWPLSQEHTRVFGRAKLLLSPMQQRLGGSLALPLKSLRQFDVPVCLADELRPAFNPQLVSCGQRIPGRLDRLRAQSHSSLLRRAVSLPLVARQARQHTVVPPRLTALSPRHDVVDRQFLVARLPAAVLARVVVTFENVPPAERDGRRGRPVVVGQRNHFRHTQPKPYGLDEPLVATRPQLRPVSQV